VIMDRRPSTAGLRPAPPRSALDGRGVLPRTVGLCVLVVVGLLLVLRSDIVGRRLLTPFNTTAAAAATYALDLLGEPAVRMGTQILGPDGLSVAIVTQCTGLDAVMLLLPAILVFPSSWRAKALGVGLALIVMSGLNLVRIVSLCYLGMYSSSALEIGHLYVWPVVVIVAALLTLLVWVERIAVPLHR
jgi:exosortase/archaeosortase family protein